MAATTATTGQENGNSTKKPENSTLESMDFEEKFLRSTFICRLLISCIWAGGVLYATYHVYISAEENLQWQRDPIMNPGPFTELLNRGRDTTDYEWYYYTESFFTSFIFWCLSYLVLNRAFQQFIPEFSQSFSAIFCVCFLSRDIGLLAAVFMVIQPVVYWLSLRLRRKAVVWIVTMLYLYFLNSTYTKIIVPSYGLSHHWLAITVAWNAARCISFCFDTWGREGSTNVKSLLSLLKYVFYFPIISNGPLVLYEKFEKDMLLNQRQPKSWEENANDLKILAHKFARLAFWMVVIELLLHYLYFRPLALTPVLLKQMNWWSLCGIAYWLGQFFHMKYVVMYGVNTAVAEFEGLEMPPLPKCIGYIHRYSALWKDFDRGLYHFLVRYTYVPTLKLLDQIDSRNYVAAEFRKLIASFSSFVYVYVWHSTSYPVFVWAAINFLGITFERMGTYVKRRVNKTYKVPGVVWDVVFEPFATAPLAAMSVMNSVIFTGELYTARVLFERFFAELSEHYVLFFTFCFAHTGVLVRCWPQAYAAYRGHRHRD